MKATSLLGVAALLVLGCNPQAGHAPPHQELPLVPVQIAVAQAKSQPILEEVVGTVQAQLHATLAAKLSGRIDQMPVLLGQTVKAGDLVVHLDAAEIEARADAAEAALQQAERDWKRTSGLYEQQAATRSDYDANEARLRSAKATVAEARAMLAYVQVQAPFDGVVSRKWAEVGDLAVPGKPLIDLEDPANLQLVADIPEAIAPKIQKEGSLRIRVDALKEAVSGTVREIAPAADPVSRTVRVKLDLPRAAGLASGQFGRLLVPTGEINSIRVPVSAVVFRGQLEIVFVVSQAHAQLHLVKTGKRFDQEVEILAGLESGDQVVTSGATLLTDGQPVEVK